LASNGLDKPVLNAFRMFGLLGNERVKAISSAALPTERVLNSGVREQPDINAIATKSEHQVTILVWNYHDDDLPAAAAPVDLSINGLPENARLGLIEHFRIDETHSNAFAAWKALGSPQSPTSAQYEELEHAGQLQLLHSPEWKPIERGTANLQFSLPRQGLSLIRITW
jgi:xylan 1,4-beta-xylosidase